jgi:hypothetical protein
MDIAGLLIPHSCTWRIVLLFIYSTKGQISGHDVRGIDCLYLSKYWNMHRTYFFSLKLRCNPGIKHFLRTTVLSKQYYYSGSNLKSCCVIVYHD